MPPREASPDPHQELLTLRRVCRAACDDLVAALPMLGDREAQRALDAYVDHIMDALRMLDAEAGELQGAAARSGPRSVEARARSGARRS